LQRFNIFIKSNKFNWTINKIVFLIFVILFLVFQINKSYKNPIQDSVNKYIGIIGLTLFIARTLYKFSRFAKPEKLNGELVGFLEFKSNSIIIDKEEYKIDEIEKINIVNNDFYGKGNGSSSGFNSNLSNGVDNYLTLILKDKRKISCMFEMYNEYDMGKLDEIIISYYSKGKLDFDDLIRIFKVKGDRKIEDFKKSIT
jgi:hypothetical protein